MDLLEYQAKELFQEMGIPVLPSQRIDHPKDLKRLKIPYPVVLKSQVRAGGRGKAGGIKFVTNTIDAVAAAQIIFHLPITGEYPEVLLAEAKYDADREFYLAVVLDAVARRPVLLGSQQGGMNEESILEQMQQVVVDQEFSPFYARRLMLKMGLQGKLIQSVSAIVQKMYQLFVQKDLDLVEINPLGISATGEVMALDGKVTANDDALGRHAALEALVSKKLDQEEEGENSTATSDLPHLVSLNLIEPGGNIAIICNGAGLTMATLDSVYQASGKPAKFLNLGEGTNYSATPATLYKCLEQGLELVTQDKNIKVVLVNIWGSVLSHDQIATGITNYLQHQGQNITSLSSPPRLRRGRGARESDSSQEVPPKTYTDNTPHFVVRLIGNELDKAKELLTAMQVYVVESLDDAVAQAVSLAS